MLAEAEDGFSLATVHVYIPAVVTARVWVYCAVTGSFNSVSALNGSVSATLSLVQVTVVAGPPVEVQVRVMRLRSSLIISDNEIIPKKDVYTNHERQGELLRSWFTLITAIQTHIHNVSD